MNDIYRIFECRHGVLTELVFIMKESVQDYLDSCNKHNKDENTFYFAELVNIEK